MGTTFVIALLVLFSNRKLVMNKLICLALLLLAFWAGSIVLTSIYQSTFFGRLTFSFGIFAIPSCIVFLKLLAGRIIAKWQVTLLFTPPLIVALLAPTEGMLFPKMEIIQGSIVTEGAGPLLPIFEFLYFFYIVWLIKVIYDGYKTLTGTKRVQLNYLSAGFAFTLGITTLTNMILPMMKIYDYTGYGPLTILPWSIATAYMATKHHIWEPRVVLSEVWALLLILAALASVSVNRGLFEFIILGMVAVGSALLVNSVLKESEANAALRQKNIQLEKDKEELKKLDKMKDEFIDMATHELNTPITAIRGRLDMAIHENLSHLTPDQSKFLEPVLADSSRLAEMVKDTLDVIQFDQKKIELHPVETDLNGFIKDVVLSFEKGIINRGNTLEFYGLKGEAPKIPLDQVRIKQVLENLIGNANKFTSKGKIIINSRLEDDRVIISVSDSGVGIAETDQEHLFEKFYQPGRFDSENPQEQQGTGLGLYICKSIIELHGGKIWLKSEKGKGSNFAFLLPLRKS